MRAAYLDTSFLLAETFGDVPGRRKHRLTDFDVLFASRFLEAEFLSAFRREGLVPQRDLLTPIQWVDAGRSLGEELGRV
ncbi:MAG TPA: hypothetical protein VG916_04600, partial [Gemmatimonadaceae bacterium]|nr:hypothetical protein [Gemmatimonadaceae bacterium]